MTGTLTPLAVEAALTVAAELGQRAGYAGKLRAAAAGRARYHADLTRRRYLAVDPAGRLVAGTLEAGWNTAPRALNDTKDTYDTAQNAATASLAETQKTRIRKLVTDFPAIWSDPATPQREHKRMTRLLLTDVTITRNAKTITCNMRWQGGQDHTLTLPVPKPPGNCARPHRTSSRRPTSCWTTTPTPRSPLSSTPAATPAAKAAPSTP
jgi:hypothetical protein